MRTKITISVFLLMLVLFAVFIIMPADEESVLKENREPAKMPKATLENIFLGDFGTDFESFLSDNVGMRGKFISISDKLNTFKGVKIFGNISNVNNDLGMGATGETKNLLTIDKKIMEIFKAKPDSAKKYSDMVNHIAKNLPEKVKVYNMIIPTQIEFEAGKDYQGISDSQKETIDGIYEMLDNKVISVDAYSALNKHSNEYIYFRTDHHWTTRGAYYAYEQFAKAAGVKAENIKNFKENKAENFLGYLYRQAQANELERYPDTIYYYTNGENLKVNAKAWENGGVSEYTNYVFTVPAVNTETTYGLFLGGDHQFLEIDARADNGRNILIIKDSYANAFIPWLTYSFDRVIAVDPRSFKGDFAQIIEEYEVTDVLMMNYVFSTTFDDLIAVEKGLYS